MKVATGKKRGAQWSVARSGIRFTVKRARQVALDNNGKPRQFRTRDAAARVARQLNAAG